MSGCHAVALARARIPRGGAVGSSRVGASRRRAGLRSRRDVVLHEETRRSGRLPLRVVEPRRRGPAEPGSGLGPTARTHAPRSCRTGAIARPHHGMPQGLRRNHRAPRPPRPSPWRLRARRAAAKARSPPGPRLVRAGRVQALRHPFVSAAMPPRRQSADDQRTACSRGRSRSPTTRRCRPRAGSRLFGRRRMGFDRPERRRNCLPPSERRPDAHPEGDGRAG